MPVYAFGPFLLKPDERRLTRDGRRIALPGKAWQILALLIEAGGRLVSHETFRSKLWPNVVVEDRTLTVHMSTLRKALGDGPDSDFIETIPREGYRLAVPVRILPEAETPSGGVPHAALATLAVRPFSEAGPEDDNYLGVGIADALATALGGVSGLTVHSPGAIGELAVGRAGGVGHVLEGSVQRKDQQLRVEARLVDLASGRTRWKERFEQPRGEAAGLQDEIALRVAGSLGPLSAIERSGLHSYRPRSTEAFFLQLQARANLKLYVKLPMMKALGFFEQALALDPDYALAHSGLAWTYLLLGSTTLGRTLPGDEAMPLARQSAERAIDLDPRLAEAWAVLGRVKMEHHWDWDGAEADLAHAVALNPSSVEALTAYGQYLSAAGRHEEAIEATDQARRLDPTRAETIHHAYLVYWMAGDDQRSLDTIDESLALGPQVIRNHYARATLLDHLGRREEAMAARLEYLRLYGLAPALRDELVELERTQGWHAAMQPWLAMLERTNRWETAAMQWMAVGDRQRALDAIEHCVRNKSTYVRFFAQCPAWLPLHDEPRFQAILRTLKLERTNSAGLPREVVPSSWQSEARAGD